MASKESSEIQHKDPNRRSGINRRTAPDRRNLVRFESLGSDRRIDSSRRYNEFCFKLVF